MQAVDAVAGRVAQTVDELLGLKWGRTHSQPSEEGSEAKVATCECGSGIPVQKVHVDGQEVTLIALPLIFQQFRQAGKMPGDGTATELMQTIKIYNPIPDGQEAAYTEAIRREYTAFCEKQEVPA